MFVLLFVVVSVFVGLMMCSHTLIETEEDSELKYFPYYVHNDSKDTIGELVPIWKCNVSKCNDTYYLRYEGKNYTITYGINWSDNISWTKYAKLTNKTGSWYY